MVFLRAAQGSRNAMLTWSTIAALAGRLILSLFTCTAYRRGRSIAEILMKLFVDGPHVAMRGTPDILQFSTAKIIASWSLIGLPLALQKLRRGVQVPWIGRMFTVDLIEQCVNVDNSRI